MNQSIPAQIQRLRKMTVAELRIRWRDLYGQESRSRNKDFLWRRLAWRVQELAHGGLSDRARQQIAELAPDSFIRAVTPRDAAPTEAPSHVDATPTRPKTVRDLRLPSAGTVITRTWHGRELRLLVLDEGYEFEGQHFDSLSQAARHVTGAHWNGKLFWGVAQRKRRS